MEEVFKNKEIFESVFKKTPRLDEIDFDYLELDDCFNNIESYDVLITSLKNFRINDNPIYIKKYNELANIISNLSKEKKTIETIIALLDTGNYQLPTHGKFYRIGFDYFKNNFNPSLYDFFFDIIIIPASEHNNNKQDLIPTELFFNDNDAIKPLIEKKQWFYSAICGYACAEIIAEGKKEIEKQQSNDSETKGRKYSLKEYALAYILDLYANDKRVPTNPIDGGYAKKELMRIGKEDYQQTGDSFYREVKAIISNCDLNKTIDLDNISKDWYNAVKYLSKDSDKINEYLISKNLVQG